MKSNFNGEVQRQGGQVVREHSAGVTATKNLFAFLEEQIGYSNTSHIFVTTETGTASLKRYLSETPELKDASVVSMSNELYQKWDERMNRRNERRRHFYWRLYELLTGRLA